MEINTKRRTSIDLNIHLSKVFSSEDIKIKGRSRGLNPIPAGVLENQDMLGGGSI